ncbi:MAG: hypothetical protein KAH54_02100 [Candidatus Sabulitectum sp.]|nr:hypothetical protein [Candidatus Sabulitectum sp.]
MKSLEGFLILIGAALWGVAFFYGINAGTWMLGKVGIVLIGLAFVVRVIEFLIPNRKPQPIRPKGPSRKCLVCGKPVTSGSKYCSYHTKYGPEDDRR